MLLGVSSPLILFFRYLNDLLISGATVLLESIYYFVKVCIMHFMGSLTNVYQPIDQHSISFRCQKKPSARVTLNILADVIYTSLCV